jgi:alanine-glyoxylate transaminase/serine-glyoxylate transaminase/serine-pyruvate transaminase
MGPGPSNVPKRILDALSRPTIGHLDPLFIEMMDQTKAMLQKAFLTKNSITIPISAPGSAGMEACLVNLIEPGDRVVICQNGVFGGRMGEIARRSGATVFTIEHEWGTAVDPQKLEDLLKKEKNIALVAFVHAETSTGAKSDAKTLTEIAHRYGALVLVDAVTSLGGIELRVDDWQLDAIYSGTQKCLSAPPGLSPISFGERAMEKLKHRKSPVQSWFLDLNLLTGYWGGQQKRAYHHTAPVNALYGLHEALVMLHEEGLVPAWERHQKNHLLLKNALEKLGLNFLVAEKDRLPQLNAVTVPSGIDEARVRERLLKEHNIEIGSGLGSLAGKIWRIGLMGHTSNSENINKLTKALASVM